MLRGMGFSNKTAIFLASGKIYRAKKNMAPLLEMFPLLQTKETLASEEELAPFKVGIIGLAKFSCSVFLYVYCSEVMHYYQNFSSRMAAIDYSVCAQSEAFVTTQGGNFPHFLMGHRRYLYGGHSKTIKPDKRRLAILFDNSRIGYDDTLCPWCCFALVWVLSTETHIRSLKSQFLFMYRWKSLKRHLLNMRAHSDTKGVEMKRPNESIYTFPCPDCMCHLNRTEHSKPKHSR